MSLPAFSLHGRRVLVTGASSGLGQAACRLIAQAGASVIATGRDADRLQATVESLAPVEHEPHRAHVADLVHEQDRRALVDGCEPLDGVVLAAGVAQVTPLRFAIGKSVQRVLSINLEARLALCQALSAGRTLADNASLVFMSSLSVQQGVTGHSSYAASLAANEGASRAIAAELVGRGIRSNVVAPGLIDTPVLEGGSVPRAHMDALIARYPLGVGAPEDVAAAIVYLLAPASRWMTGQVLRLDGGYTLDV